MGADGEGPVPTPPPSQPAPEDLAHGQGQGQPPAPATHPALPQVAQEEIERPDAEIRREAQQPEVAAQESAPAPGEPAFRDTQHGFKAKAPQDLQEQRQLEGLAEAEAVPRRYRALFVLRVVPGRTETGTAAARLADDHPRAKADASILEQALPAEPAAEAPAPAGPAGRQ